MSLLLFIRDILVNLVQNLLWKKAIEKVILYGIFFPVNQYSESLESFHKMKHIRYHQIIPMNRKLINKNKLISGILYSEQDAF